MHLLLEAAQLLLDELGGSLGVCVLHPVHPLHELSRADIARPIVVEHDEHFLQITGIDVEHAEQMAELLVPPGPLFQLLEIQRAVAICVDFVEDVAQHLLLLLLVPLHLAGPREHVLGARFREGVNDHGHDHVEDTEHEGQQGPSEDEEGPRVGLDDWDRHQAPAVACHNRLKEGDVGVEHRGESPAAPLAIGPLAPRRQLEDLRVDELHRHDRPHRHDHPEYQE
mmetsp:Transcript_90476/g.242636  ORF Transcript_90476/g.242636 Transcript_90476/m.242636 type:complete len:225 (-) Transcript_90476:190-864(-)